MTPLPLLALAVRVSAAALPERSIPELETKNSRASEASCAVRAYSWTVSYPSFPPLDPAVVPATPDSYKKAVRDREAAARGRIAAARRATWRIYEGIARVVSTTQDCRDWAEKRLDALAAAGEGGAREEAEAFMTPFLPKGGALSWSEGSAKTEASPVPPEDRYSSSCRAPDVDAAFFAPEAPDLPSSAREKLAGVADAARAVSTALADQKAALEDLLKLGGGRRCRETLQAFDGLAASERAAFYAYREKAVAGAVWPSLKWEKVAPK